jgi:hypothetical protein
MQNDVETILRFVNAYFHALKKAERKTETAARTSRGIIFREEVHTIWGVFFQHTIVKKTQKRHSDTVDECMGIIYASEGLFMQRLTSIDLSRHVGVLQQENLYYIFNGEILVVKSLRFLQKTNRHTCLVQFTTEELYSGRPGPSFLYSQPTGQVYLAEKVANQYFKDYWTRARSDNQPFEFLGKRLYETLAFTVEGFSETKTAHFLADQEQCKALVLWGDTLVEAFTLNQVNPAHYKEFNLLSFGKKEELSERISELLSQIKEQYKDSAHSVEIEEFCMHLFVRRYIKAASCEYSFQHIYKVAISFKELLLFTAKRGSRVRSDQEIEEVLFFTASAISALTPHGKTHHDVLAMIRIKIDQLLKNETETTSHPRSMKRIQQRLQYVHFSHISEACPMCPDSGQAEAW